MRGVASTTGSSRPVREAQSEPPSYWVIRRFLPCTKDG
jgi:hypothetical protein